MQIVPERGPVQGLPAGYARKVLEKKFVAVKVGTLAADRADKSGPENLLNLCSHSVLQPINATLFCIATDELGP